MCLLVFVCVGKKIFFLNWNRRFWHMAVVNSIPFQPSSSKNRVPKFTNWPRVPALLRPLLRDLGQMI